MTSFYSGPLPNHFGIMNVNTKATYITDNSNILYIVLSLYFKVKSQPLYKYIALYMDILLHKLLAYMLIIILLIWTAFIFCNCPNIWNFHPIGYLYTFNICFSSAKYALGLLHFLTFLHLEVSNTYAFFKSFWKHPHYKFSHIYFLPIGDINS